MKKILSFLLLFVVIGSLAAGTPPYKPYQPGTYYITNSLVSHNGNNYQAEWGTQNEPGSSDWDGWDLIGPYDENEPLCFQAAWPPYVPVEGGVQAGTRVSYNGRNYIAAYPTVLHPTDPNGWSDAGPCIEPIDGELGFLRVEDNRKYASCQNFASGGKFYEFRISGEGQLHYWIDNVYQGIFSFDKERNGSKGIHYETSAKGTEFTVPPLSMVAADNNRVIVKSAENNKTYWASLVDEYPHDFELIPEGSHNPISVSVPGHFTALNPEFGKDNFKTPRFPKYPYTHFGTINFYNPLPLTNDGLKEFFGEDFKLETNEFNGTPDLADMALKKAERLFGDAIGIAVQPGVFYEIGAVPPRNGVSLSTHQMTDAAYKQIVYDAWSKSFSEVLEVIKDEMIYPNEAKLKEAIVNKIMEGYHKGQNPDDGKGLTQEIWDDRSTLEQVGLHTLAKLNLGVSKTGWDLVDYIIRKIRGKLIDKVNQMNMATYVDIINSTMNAYLRGMRDGTYTEKKFEKVALDAAERVIKELLTKPKNTFSWKKLGRGALNGMAGEILTGMYDEIKNQLVNSIITLGSIAMSMDDADESDKDSVHFWAKQYWNSWHNYYNDLKAPGKTFGLKNTYPYHYQPNWVKQQLDILEVYDVGVNNPHRYEHARKQNGGEIQNFFHEYTVEEFKTTTLTDGSYWTSMIDGNGYNDGTCNFYMLAKIRVASDGSDYPDQETIAVLWLDEQEYFSERWRVAHPLGSTFEGLPGNMLNMFPVLAWEDGVDLPEFVKSYWAPFQAAGFIDTKSRIATSRYAVAISGVEELYTTAFFWATSDYTWRSRKYPEIDPAKEEYLDRSSIQIRDDQTIFMAGRKNIRGKILDGYYYQRFVPHSNDYGSDPVKGNLVYGKQPQVTDYTWYFMEKNQFETAHQSFFRMGIYDTTKNPLAKGAPEYDVYNFRGYTPSVHVIRSDEKLNVPNDTELLITELDGTDYLHPMYQVSEDWNKSDDRPVKTEIVLPKVYLKVKQIPFLGETKTYMTFSDKRNDDLGIFLVNQNTPNVDVKQFTYDLKYGSSTVSRVSYGNTEAGVNRVIDLNVWSDAPLGEIELAEDVAYADLNDESFIASEATGQKTSSPVIEESMYEGKTYLRCKFTMPKNPDYFHESKRDIPVPGMARYIFRAVKIGIIDPATGKHEVVAHFNVGNPDANNPEGATRYGYAELTPSEWADIKETYLSEAGLAQYGTSVWAEDYFDNDNTFTAIKGIAENPNIHVKNIGDVNSSHYIKPGITRLWVTNFPEWNFNNAIFACSGLSAPLDGEVYIDGEYKGALSNWYKTFTNATTGKKTFQVEIHNYSDKPFLLQWWVNINR